MNEDFVERRQDIDRRHDYADFAEQFGEIKAGIRSLTSSVGEIKNSLSGNNGLVSKTSGNEKDIAVIKDQMGTVNKILWAVGGTALASIVTAIMTFIIRKSP